MKKLNFALTISVLFILVGCGTSRDYTPPTDASGETIFSTACTECHKPLSANVAMILSEKVANKEAIIKKFQSGSMKMPAITRCLYDFISPENRSDSQVRKKLFDLAIS